ncbi:unannotated protein [freshwater metagenome]|uniref:Unannotated protein n=1 Tax=freshwater metagenome TaxID=449393 RepID=A0A6J6BCH0_9ZZZZ|nr:hypothetical protein [Actinomycetota bacterium]MSW14816.1 hypothetical protein [Actinomycetota bacterium]MSW98910.1 hypothetical protein [Actinomycetota bacterium]MSY82581.1 hypothetical protein [Actinomycetota bacterium]MSZ45699.1 hypothetical protein [Actinomycetota bacterium]
MRTINRNRLTLVILAVALSLSSSLSIAYATNSSRFIVPNTTTISTGKFVLYPVDTTTAGNPAAPLVLLDSASKQFFYTVNGGNFQSTAFTLTISSSQSTTIALTRCALNVKFTANNTCASGSQVTVYGNTTAPVVTTITLTIPAGSWYHFQLTPGKKTRPTASITLSSLQITNNGTINS